MRLWLRLRMMRWKSSKAWCKTQRTTRTKKGKIFVIRNHTSRSDYVCRTPLRRHPYRKQIMNNINESTEVGVVLPQPCSAWRRTTESFPPQDVEVEITHPNFIGTRTAIMRAGSGWYLLTPCTHPSMIFYAPLEDSGWRMKPNATTEPRHEK